METITVQFVNQPKAGAKMGSIKTADGRTLGVWPDKLAQFQPGGTYNVEVQGREYQGKTYYNVSKIVSNGSAPAPASAPAPRVTDEATAERIFACGIVNAWVANTAFDGRAPEPSELAAVTNNARAAWRMTFGAKPGETPPAVESVHDDPLPF